MSDGESTDPHRGLAPPWPKGTSGNPGGRSKVQREIQDALDASGPKAREVIEALLSSDNDKVRLAAAKDILDRVLGRPATIGEESRDALANELMTRLLLKAP